MAADLLAWGLRSALAVSVALALVLALRPLWRRSWGSGAVLWLWLLVPAALLATVLPRGSVPGPATATRVAQVRMAGTEAIASDGLAARGPETAAAAAATTGAGAMPAGSTIALGIWFAGAALMAGHFGWQQARYRRRLGRLHRDARGHYVSEHSDLGPAVLGALRPRIVLPADFERRYEPRHRELVLAHERVHLRRGDLQANLAMCLLRGLYWFNPLVHLAAARLRVDQELACDAAVLRRHPHARRDYAEAMLRTQLADLGLPVGCHWQSSQSMKWRIAMIRQPSPGLARALLGAGLALSAGAATAAAVWQAQPVRVVVLPPIAVTALAGTPVYAPMAIAGPVDRLDPVASLAQLPREAADVASSRAHADPGLQPVAPERRARATLVPVPPEPPADAATGARYQAPIPLAGNDPPRYPMTARSRDFRGLDSGVVEVRATVDATGAVQDAAVSSSQLGRAFDIAAVESVREWRFSPAVENGQAIAATVVLPIRYTRESQRFTLLEHPQSMPLAPGSRRLQVW
jgi:bla regulator protein BlaR1